MFVVSLMGGEIAIEGSPGHTKARTDTLHRGRPGFIQLEGHRKGIWGDRFGAFPIVTPLACAGQACHGAFPDEIAFELCKRTRHVQEKLTCSCSELRISDAQLDNSAWFLLALGLLAIFGEVESTGT
jgi:hypothetical protein